ncbi:hypothetical protein QQ045_026618 [Rhodiola kirilowii]
MSQTIEKEEASTIEADTETGRGTSHHCGDELSEFLKVVVHGRHEVEKYVKVTEKPKNTRVSKKVYKPPRHPRGPSLDAADRRFIEAIVLKRVKTERLKELKSLDASPASKEMLFYLLVSIILALLILIQITKLGA